MNDIKKEFFSLFELTRKYRRDQLVFLDSIDSENYKGLEDLITNNKFSDIPLIVLAKKDTNGIIFIENSKLIYLIKYVDSCLYGNLQSNFDKMKMIRLEDHQILLITYSNENDQKELEKFIY